MSFVISLGVRILNGWWKSGSVVTRSDFPIVRRNLFSNIYAFWTEIRALPAMQSRRNYLPDKGLAEEEFIVTRKLLTF
jgi:hypothetical protein